MSHSLFGKESLVHGGLLLGAFRFFSFLLTALHAHAGPVHELLWSFHTFPKHPTQGALVFGPDGYYWGTSEEGGVSENGTVYKVRPDGSEWSVVVSFTGSGGPNPGRLPFGGLVSDQAGNLWGTTSRGGTSDLGTIFRVNAQTGEFTSVLRFTGTQGVNRGALPGGELVWDERGYFWGTTRAGGSANVGTVYKVNAATGELTTLSEFSGTVGRPSTGLTSDGKGYFWGATAFGTRNIIFKVQQDTGSRVTVADLGGDSSLNRLVDDGQGFLWGTTSSTIFKVEIATGALSTVYQATNAQFSGLINDGAGSLWGGSGSGGGQARGEVFKIDIQTGRFTRVSDLASSPVLDTDFHPVSTLVMDASGSFLGTTRLNHPKGPGTVFKVNAANGEITVLTTFNDEHSDERGTFPYAGLVSDGAGYFWGTTQHGGLGNGTVYKLDEVTWQLTTVVQFSNVGEINRGAEPRAMLAPDGQGYLWGSTSEGGTENAGTIFKVNIATGELTTIVEFSGNEGENRGARPVGELTSDGNGFFWGTTSEGRTSRGGTIFKVNIATGELITVHDTDDEPYAGLAADGSGSFWGTTNRGGEDDSGTIFKVDIATGQFTHVLQFDGLSTPNLGTEPRARLFNDGKGAFWGITSEGGNSGGARGLGTVFRVDTATKQLTTVIRFTGRGGANRGSEPRPQLIRDAEGYLVGTTWKGGASDNGTVFALNPDTGQRTTLVEFSGLGAQANSGRLPGYGALLLHTDGNLYGVTQEGGPKGGGTIFRLRYDSAALAVTLAANPVNTVTATLHGTINPNGNPTTVQFEIGTSPTLEGASIVNAGTSTAGLIPEMYQHEVTDLKPGTVYYFRIVGTSAENAAPQRGRILSFRTTGIELPVVALLGKNPLTLEASYVFTDPGATATDPEDGPIVPVKTSDTVLPRVPGSYAVTWSATDRDAMTASATRTVEIVDTTKPVLAVPADISVFAEETSGVVVAYALATATDIVGVTQINYTHPAGIFPIGITTVTVTARDAAGNETVGAFRVRVTLAHAVHHMFAREGGIVIGGGVDPRIPYDAVWSGFESPAVSQSGKIAFIGRWTAAPSVSDRKGLFINGRLAAAIGEPSPLPGTTFRRFSAPVFAQDSDAVLIVATVAGSGKHPQESELLLSFTPAVTLLAQVGSEIGVAQETKLRRLLGATLNSSGSLILAQLGGGRPRVNSTNNLSLYAVTPGGLVTLARTGQTMLGKTVADLRVLESVPGAPAQGRFDASAAGVRFIARFTDRTEAIVETAEPGNYVALARTGEPTGEPGSSPTWATFGEALSSSADGGRFAFRAGTFAPLSEFSPPNDAIFVGSAEGFSRVAGVGSPAPGKTSGAFVGFGEPVLSADGESLAFLGQIEVNRVALNGIFAIRGDGQLAAVATLASLPPGLPSGEWKSFVSLAAMSGGVGPIFEAKLRLGGTITQANDTGLWAVDSASVLRKVVREGDEVEGKQVKSIQALRAVNGIRGATRSFNSSRQLVWKGSFSDRTSAIVLTTVP
jgi:uncharacterized repeat protein (TIGR03803 family)